MATPSATVQAGISVKETFDATEVPAGSAPSINSAGFVKTLSSLGPSSNPAVTKSATFKKALAAGAATIDFTSLPKTVGGTQSATGLKLRGLQINNPGANSVTVSPGAANGYEFNGSDTLVVRPNGFAVLWLADGLTAVDGTHKTLDLAGTGTDEFEIVLLFG